MKNIFVALAIVYGICASAALAQQRPPTPSELQGAWKLTSLTRDGQSRPASGYLLFDGNHYTYLTTRERPDLAEEVGRKSLEQLTDAEKVQYVELFRSMTAGAGTYTIENGEIVFVFEVARLPHLIGGREKRKAWMENGKLIQEFIAGGQRQVYVWERVK